MSMPSPKASRLLIAACLTMLVAQAVPQPAAAQDRKAVTIGQIDIKGIAQGDHVDLLVVRTEKSESMTDLLARNVEVLTIYQLAGAVTLEVTPEQAKKISSASTKGKLSLRLRRGS